MEGRDLNPLLQDPGMIIHPPMLYMGYVGFAVPFAFAIAALLDGSVDARWLRWTRPWTNVAWGFLTIGIALGSWWAYYELGWGGWWFWDPVENASFMPWLVGAALLHSQAVTEKRGSFRGWTLLLAIAAFSLSLLGTFLVRSGVLTSVHAFAADPTRGLFVLVFLGIVIGGSLLLYVARVPRLEQGAPFTASSRETLLLVNNLLLTSACAMVLLGTLYPLLADALELGKISVGPPYFGLLFLLLMGPLVLLIPFGPLTRWQREEPSRPLRMLAPWAVLALVLAAIAFFMAPQGKWKTAAGIGTAAWVALGTARFLWSRFQSKGNALHRRDAGHGPGPWRGRRVPGRRAAGRRPERATRTGADAGPDFRGRRYAFQFHGVDEAAGPNYLADAWRCPGTPGWQAPGRAASGKARLRQRRPGHERSRHLSPRARRCLRGAGRIAGRGIPRGTRAHQAVRALDLAGRRADGAGRLRHRHRPPFPQTRGQAMNQPVPAPKKTPTGAFVFAGRDHRPVLHGLMGCSTTACSSPTAPAATPCPRR